MAQPARAEALARDTAAMLRLMAEPPVAGELVKQQIGRAARRCRLTYERARKLWYGEATVSGVDLALIVEALGRDNDLVIAYQTARAKLAAARADAVRKASP